MLQKTTLLLCILLVCGCIHAQKIETLRIDPTYARGGTASQLFDEVNYIPLENTKESTFGDIQRFQSSKHYFVFFDNSTKALFIFDKKGKFKGKINALPSTKTNDVSWELMNYVLEPSSEHIFIVYGDGSEDYGKSLAVFDASGKLLQSKKLNPTFNNLDISFAFLDSNTTIFNIRYEDTPQKCHLQLIKNFDSLATGLLPVKKDDLFNKSWLRNYNVSTQSFPGAILSRNFDFTCYRLDNNSALTGYKIIFPASLTLDSSFYKDTTILGNYQKTNEYNHVHKDKANALRSIYASKKLITFSIIKDVYTSAMDVFIYSFLTKSTYCMGKISPDSLNYSLPLFSAGNVLGLDDKYMYGSVPSYEMFKAKDDDLTKPWEANTILKDYFSTQNRKSNPVLIQIKLKENL